MNLLSVILCGGSGSRLWPLSREQYPKQLLALVGENSLLQDTLLRLDRSGLHAGAGTVPALVIANEEYRFLVAEQVRQVRPGQVQIALEPCGRNTAPALTLAALHARTTDPILVVMPADHVIADQAAFASALRLALRHAEQGKVVTFGIVPDAPETGFGYIQRGADLGEGACALQGFAEKPDQATASRYLESGDYFWNSGIFVLRASVWLAEIARHRPDILAACEAALVGGESDQDFIRLDAAAFAACPSDSITSPLPGWV